LPIKDAELLERSAVRRASLRLVWLLILLYLLNNIDRTNVGFAALTMNRDLGLTAQSFGAAVGMFYVGYLLCEIPSNIILARTGGYPVRWRWAQAVGRSRGGRTSKIHCLADDRGRPPDQG